MSLNTQHIRYTAQPYGRNHVRLLSDPGPCTVTSSRTCSPRHVKQGHACRANQSLRLHDLVPAEPSLPMSLPVNCDVMLLEAVNKPTYALSS